MRARAGATTTYLILLAVAVVLGVLGFVWLTSRSSASLQALSARNLLQWGIALNLHLVENEDRLPSVGGALASSDAKDAWYNVLPTSIGEPALTELPVGERPKPGQDSLWVDPGTKPSEARGNWGEFFFTLGMNYWLQPTPDEPAWKIYRLTDPARTVFLTQVAGPRPGLAPETVVYRYGGTGAKAIATVLFCDGHAAALTRPQLSGAPGDEAFAQLWRPFPTAPDPDYEELAIRQLPEPTEELEAEP